MLQIRVYEPLVIWPRILASPWHLQASLGLCVGIIPPPPLKTTLFWCKQIHEQRKYLLNFFYFLQFLECLHYCWRFYCFSNTVEEYHPSRPQILTYLVGIHLWPLEKSGQEPFCGPKAELSFLLRMCTH